MIKTKNSDLRRPYFVYGTLRAGQCNSARWRYGHGRFGGSGEISGFKMTLDYGIPFVVPSDDPNDVVVGDLIYPTGTLMDMYDLQQSLDRLEGYPYLYDRVVVQVSPDAASVGVEAWLYSPPPDGREYERFVPSPANFNLVTGLR